MRVLSRLREWSGVLALCLVLAGGTAYAANEWTGANIVNESLTGVDVKADTIKGADVLETSLGKVPDANRLDNLDSSRFLQGGAAVPGAFGTSNAKAYFNRVASPAGSGQSTILEIPNLLHLNLDCTATQATIRIRPDVDLDLFYVLSVSAEPGHTSLAAGTAGILASTSATHPDLYWNVQVGDGENTFGLQRTTELNIFWEFTASSGCVARVTALAQET